MDKKLREKELRKLVRQGKIPASKVRAHSITKIPENLRGLEYEAEKFATSRQVELEDKLAKKLGVTSRYIGGTWQTNNSSKSIKGILVAKIPPYTIHNFAWLDVYGRPPSSYEDMPQVTLRLH